VTLAILACVGVLIVVAGVALLFAVTLRHLK